MRLIIERAASRAPGRRRAARGPIDAADHRASGEPGPPGGAAPPRAQIEVATSAAANSRYATTSAIPSLRASPRRR